MKKIAILSALVGLTILGSVNATDQSMQIIESVKTKPLSYQIDFINMLDEIKSSLVSEFYGEIIRNQRTTTTGTPNNASILTNNAKLTNFTATTGLTAVAIQAPISECPVKDINFRGFILKACNAGSSKEAKSLTDSTAFGGYYQYGNSALLNRAPTTRTQIDTKQYGPSEYNEEIFVIHPEREIQTNADLRGDITDTDSARQGPCETGYHVPTFREWELMLRGDNPYDYFQYLKLPIAGYMDHNHQTIPDLGLYQSSTQQKNLGNYLGFDKRESMTRELTHKGNALSVRCFLNTDLTTQINNLNDRDYERIKNNLNLEGNQILTTNYIKNYIK